MESFKISGSLSPAENEVCGLSRMQISGKSGFVEKAEPLYELALVNLINIIKYEKWKAFYPDEYLNPLSQKRK